MIQKLDTKGFTGVFQPFRDLDIFPAWCKAACRVVVGKDNFADARSIDGSVKTSLG